VDPAAEAEGQRRATEEFGPELAPYGSWVDDPWYGRIWVPSRSVVGSGFVPYSSAGHWQLTPDDAWLWASDYPFGGVTFHYGRWVWASGGVWGWVPGYVYAPAWVDFRIGAAGYIGWVPLAPSYVWRRGAFVSVGLWRAPSPIYCPTQYVFTRSMPRYVVRDYARVRSLSAQTHPYRPAYRSGRYVSSGRYAYVGRGPSPAEARIPARALPARRVPAQPRIAGSQYSRESRTAQRPHISVTGNGSRRSGSQNDFGWNGSGHNYSNTYATPRGRNYDEPSGSGRREMSPDTHRPAGPSNMRRPSPATRPQDARGQQWRSGGTPDRASPHAARPPQPRAQPESAGGGQRNVRRTAMPEASERDAAGRARQSRAGASYAARPDTRSYSRPDAARPGYSRPDAARPDYARPDYARSNRSDYSRPDGGQQRATRRSGGSGDSQSYRGRNHSRSYR
jgi:hypothetical protein